MDDTNTFTTGVTLNGTILEFDRTDSLNAYNVELSGLTLSFTGQSLSQTLSIGNNTGSNDIIMDVDDVILASSGGTLLDLRAGSDGSVTLGQPSATYGGKGGFGNGGGILFLSSNGITLAHDGGSFNDFYFYTEKDNYGQLARYRTGDTAYYGFNLYGDNTFQNFSTGVSIKDNEINSFTSANKNNPAIIIGSRSSTINSGITNSVIVGGQNITGTTDDTVYTPIINANDNIYTQGDYIIQTNEIDPETLVTQFPSAEVKGYYQLYNYTGSTGFFNFNTSASGSTGILFGQSTAPNPRKFGIMRYHSDDFVRDSSPTNGSNFYQNKVTYQIGNETDGTVVNIAPSNNNGRYWFEQNGNSPMVIAGGGTPSDIRLGISLNPNGTEIPSAKLQVGGTGTTGTFRYIDGNQQIGRVLTSDASGNATWQASGSFTGNTSGDCITDLYVSNLYGCSPITVNDDLLVLSNLETKNGLSIGTSYNPTGDTITINDSYIRYNLTADTEVILPSTNFFTPTPKEGHVLNIIKFGSHNLKLKTSVEQGIQGPPDGKTPTPGTFGHNLDLLSANTVSVTLIYDGGLDSWVVMSSSNYNDIQYGIVF